MAPATSPDRPLTRGDVRRMRTRTDMFGIPLIAGLAAFGLALLPELIPVAIVLLVLVVAFASISVAGTKAQGVPVSDTLHEAIARAATLATHRLGVAATQAPPILLVQDAQANASYAWAPFGHVVQVTSGLAKLLEGDELGAAFVLGHELAHGLYRHVAWSILIDALEVGAPRLRPVWGLLVLFWSRAAERSCDRVGLALCNSPLAAARTMLALASGQVIADDRALRKALATLPRRPGGLLGYFAEAFSSHPFLRPRLEALFEFASSDQYATIVGFSAAESARFELSALGWQPDRRGGPSWAFPQAVTD